MASVIDLRSEKDSNETFKVLETLKVFTEIIFLKNDRSLSDLTANLLFILKF